MVQRVSVRRARIEEQRARKQIIIASVVAVVLGGIFFLVIFPLMLRGVVFLAQQGSTPTEDVKQLPPQAPMIAAPAQYNNTGVLELSGFTSPDVQVKLIVNEQERGTERSDSNGAFELEVDLAEGEYEIYVFAEGKDKNTSPDSVRYDVIVDRTKPTLVIETPMDGAIFTLRSEQNQVFKGKLSEPGFVIINGNSRIRTNSEGEFQAPIQLPEGETTYSFVGEDLAGNQSATMERRVRFN